MIQLLNLNHGDAALRVPLAQAFAAGYTGRDREQAQQHIAELAEIGVPPPPRVPMLYPLMPTLVTDTDHIAVVGYETTPEVEVAVLDVDDELYLTVASDHTDRDLERLSVTLAKNTCPKVVGSELWRFSDVRDHWDDLELTSRWQGTTLQQGTLGSLMRCEDLLAFVDDAAGRARQRVIFGGTIATLAAPAKRTGEEIELELRDPVLQRSITHSYKVHVLEELFS